MVPEAGVRRKAVTVNSHMVDLVLVFGFVVAATVLGRRSIAPLNHNRYFRYFPTAPLPLDRCSASVLWSIPKVSSRCELWTKF